ncbi:SDR family NAD(P)-dependent oxidoreductase [Mycobacterium paraintracellulare]|nr:hypothetical protein B8W68_25705 [Mycobacterium paraintracellulare]
MIDRRSGAVAIFLSLAGILSPPVNFAAYGASKAATPRNAHALHYEIARVGISVTARWTGPVDTEFGVSSGLEATWLPCRVASRPPGDCVAVIWDALERGEAISNASVRAAGPVTGPTRVAAD